MKLLVTWQVEHSLTNRALRTNAVSHQRLHTHKEACQTKLRTRTGSEDLSVNFDCQYSLCYIIILLTTFCQPVHRQSRPEKKVKGLCESSPRIGQYAVGSDGQFLPCVGVVASLDLLFLLRLNRRGFFQYDYALLFISKAFRIV